MNTGACPAKVVLDYGWARQGPRYIPPTKTKGDVKGVKNGGIYLAVGCQESLGLEYHGFFKLFFIV